MSTKMYENYLPDTNNNNNIFGSTIVQFTLNELCNVKLELPLYLSLEKICTANAIAMF